MNFRKNMQTVGGFLDYQSNIFTSDMSKNPFKLGVLNNDLLHSGRSCIHRILHINEVKILYVPEFCCQSIKDMLSAFEIEVQYYPLDDALKPLSYPHLNTGDYFLFCNFFGLQRELCDTVNLKFNYGHHGLILDLTHDLDAIVQNYYQESFRFISLRKWFGLPDGAILRAPLELDLALDRLTPTFPTVYTDHLLPDGQLKTKYNAFLYNEKSISSELLSMSEFSLEAIQFLDVHKSLRIRKKNAAFLNLSIGRGQPYIRELSEAAVCLPVRFSKDMTSIKKALIEKGIYLPTYWVSSSEKINKKYSAWVNNTLYLPVDHRYQIEDMSRMLALILELAYKEGTEIIELSTY